MSPKSTPLAKAARTAPAARRPQRSPLDVAIAQLEEAVKNGTVEPEAGQAVIAQLRRARPDETHDGNGSRREHILNVAARVFARKGYRATSLQEIADEVGVTRPSFYYHFKSKQEILGEILISALERAERTIDEVLAGPGTSIDRLRAFVLRYVEINTEHSEVPVLFQSAGELEPEAAERARQRRSDIDHKLARLIADGIAAGELRAQSPLIAAYGMLGAINWMHTWYHPDGRFQPREIAGMLADLLLDGIAVPGARKGVDSVRRTGA